MKTTLSVASAACVLIVGQAWAGSDDRAEVAAFLQAPHSLTAAIATAEAATGGQAYAAEYDHDDGAGHYEVRTLNGDKLAEVKIDAAKGTALKSVDKGLLSDKDADDGLDPAQLSMPLAELIAAAEAETGGKVMSIEHERDDGRVALDVEIASAEGGIQDFAFDAVSGKFVLRTGGHGDKAVRSQTAPTMEPNAAPAAQ